MRWLHICVVLLSLTSSTQALAGSFTATIKKAKITTTVNFKDKDKVFEKKFVKYLKEGARTIQTMSGGTVTIHFDKKKKLWQIKISRKGLLLGQKKGLKLDELRSIAKAVPSMLAIPETIVITGPASLKTRIAIWRKWLRSTRNKAGKVRKGVETNTTCPPKKICRTLKFVKHRNRWVIQASQLGVQYADLPIPKNREGNMRHAIRVATWMQGTAFITISIPGSSDWLGKNAKQINKALRQAIWLQEGIRQDQNSSVLKVEAMQVGRHWMIELEKPSCVIALKNKKELLSSKMFLNAIIRHRQNRCLASQLSRTATRSAPTANPGMATHSKGLLGTSIGLAIAGVGLGIWSLNHNRFYHEDQIKSSIIGIAALTCGGASAVLQIIFWATLQASVKSQRTASPPTPTQSAMTQTLMHLQ